MNSSIIGTSHIKLGVNCQDANVCQLIKTPNGEEILITIVSDGAGSAKYAEIGSKLTCELLFVEFKNFFEVGRTLKDFDRNFALDLVKFIQKEIALRIETPTLNLRDYACTTLFTIIDQNSAVFFQIGDGAIVISSEEDPNEYNWVFWPQRGEFENTTHFITDELATEFINFDRLEKPICRIALFTDGLQSLALQYKTKTVYSPFFNRLFTYLEHTSEYNPEKLSLPLSDLLNSQLINERTDDDKTLVLAMRYLK